MRLIMKHDAALRCGLIALSCLAFPSQDGFADEPTILIPKKESSTVNQEKNVQRSTYESLTEERGTFKVIKDQKEREAKEKQAKERAARGEPPEDLLPPQPTQAPKEQNTGPVINFNNVTITEVLKYVSRLTGKNFVYDPGELQFAITMISDSPTSVEEVMAMVIQSLRVHGFIVMEEGGSYVIHTNPTVKTAGALEEEALGINGPQLATRVFVLQNLLSDQVAAVVKAMVSDGALVEAVGDSRVIVSDSTENLNRIADVIKQMDSQTGGLEIGQYVAINTSPTTLMALSNSIIAPLAVNKPLVLVPHTASNSIFIVSTPFLIERTMAIMQTIDLNLARSGILPSDMKFDAEAAQRAKQLRDLEESQKQSAQEKELQTLSEDDIRQRLIEQGIEPSTLTNFTIDAAREALRVANRKPVSESDLPIGSVEATQFLIYRLQYRNSGDIANALRAIASSLMGGGPNGPNGGPIAPELAQSDLIMTLNSLQPVDENNTIVFTGTRASIKKAKELISQLDIPVRQVFIEGLVLDTTLSTSLQFSVEWEGKIQRQNFGAEVGFRNPTAPAFGTAFDNIQQITPVQVPPPPAPGGLSVGTLGRKIKFRGKGFRVTGALIQALSSDDETHVIMNPKITTEHNVPAQIFVGDQTPIKGQSIANSSIGSTSSIVATNYETQQTGIELKVTPLISADKTVTLIIEQKVSSADAAQVANQGNVNAPPATIHEIRTVTRVHLPSDHFLVISGMLSEDSTLHVDRIPCLGMLPIVGALFGDRRMIGNKRVLMIFIKPTIIDNEVDEITRQQELVLKQKSTAQEGWNRDLDETKTLLNLRQGPMGN